METNESVAIVELKIPCKPEFVGVARLAILGVASRMKFTYDEVEDVRLAVGEACTTSVEWAEKNGRGDAFITLVSEISTEKLVVDIIDEAGARSSVNQDDITEIEPENLGALLITLLVDEVSTKDTEKGSSVRMTKYARQ